MQFNLRTKIIICTEKNKQSSVAQPSWFLGCKWERFALAVADGRGRSKLLQRLARIWRAPSWIPLTTDWKASDSHAFECFFFVLFLILVLLFCCHQHLSNTNTNAHKNKSQNYSHVLTKKTASRIIRIAITQRLIIITESESVLVFRCQITFLFIR